MRVPIDRAGTNCDNASFGCWQGRGGGCYGRLGSGPPPADLLGPDGTFPRPRARRSIRQPRFAALVLSSLQGGKNWRASEKSARSFFGRSEELAPIFASTG